MHPAVFALKRTYQTARNALEADLHGRGLTVAQLDALKLLLRPDPGTRKPADGTQDQRVMQKALGISSATLTRLLAGMERRGFVTRTSHPRDSRGKRVRATAKARALFETLMAEGEAAFNARLLRGFSEEETRTLVELLNRLTANMATGPADTDL